MRSLEYWQTNKSFDTFTILNDWWGFLFVVFRVLVFVDSTQFYFLDRMKGFPDKETDLDSRPQSTCRHMLYVESFHFIFRLFPDRMSPPPWQRPRLLCWTCTWRGQVGSCHAMSCHVMQGVISAKSVWELFIGVKKSVTKYVKNCSIKCYLWPKLL